MDTVKSSTELSINWQFADDDTRTITIANPRSDLSAEDIGAFEADTVSKGILIGDKTSAALTGIKVAKRIDKTDYALDF